MEIKKSTEVIVLGGMLALSLASTFADATTIGGGQTSTTVPVASSAAGGYVLEAFNLNLSANVKMTYDGDTQAVGVKTGNLKGMHTFGGSSNGGAVKQCEAGSLAASAIATGAGSVTIATGC